MGHAPRHETLERLGNALVGATDISSWLKAWRHTRRMTQLELAEALGYDVTYIVKIEGGTRRPSRQFLTRLELVTDVPHPWPVGSDVGAWSLGRASVP